jgi:hypothetical protein
VAIEAVAALVGPVPRADHLRPEHAQALSEDLTSQRPEVLLVRVDRAGLERPGLGRGAAANEVEAAVLLEEGGVVQPRRVDQRRGLAREVDERVVEQPEVPVGAELDDVRIVQPEDRRDAVHEQRAQGHR